MLDESFLDLLLDRAVDSRVGDAAFLFQKELIPFLEAFKRAAFGRVVLGVLHAVFDLPFVAWRIGLRGNEGGAVMSGKRLQFGMTLRDAENSVGPGDLAGLVRQVLRRGTLCSDPNYLLLRPFPKRQGPVR